MKWTTMVIVALGALLIGTVVADVWSGHILYGWQALQPVHYVGRDGYDLSAVRRRSPHRMHAPTHDGRTAELVVTERLMTGGVCRRHGKSRLNPRGRDQQRLSRAASRKSKRQFTFASKALLSKPRTSLSPG